MDWEIDKSGDSWRSLFGDLSGEWGWPGGLLASAGWVRDGEPKGGKRESVTKIPEVKYPEAFCNNIIVQITCTIV